MGYDVDVYKNNTVWKLNLWQPHSSLCDHSDCCILSDKVAPENWISNSKLVKFKSFSEYTSNETKLSYDTFTDVDVCSVEANIPVMLGWVCCHLLKNVAL